MMVSADLCDITITKSIECISLRKKNIHPRTQRVKSRYASTVQHYF